MRERRDVDPRRVAKPYGVVRVALVELGPGGADQEQGHAFGVVVELFEEGVAKVRDATAASLTFNRLIRQAHRWLSIAFTLLVIANFVGLALHKQSTALGLATLVPLFLLLFSGLYMFALPYLPKRD